MMKLKIFVILIFSVFLLNLSGIGETEEKITVFIPRELFFSGGLEEQILSFFEEWGGIVGTLDEDIQTFWRNYSANAGRVNIEVTFSRTDLTAIGLEMKNELLIYFEELMDIFDSISTFEREASNSYTRFIIRADFDEFIAEPGFIGLLDFAFPDIGVIEYLYRVFHQYNMADLKEIVFFVQDIETLERTEIYSFFDDAPRGLGMRHGVVQ